MMAFDINVESGHGRKKKTTDQLQLLEKLYSEEKYPTTSDLQDYATLLNLTYKQTRTWFIEKRRKEKREKKVHYSSKSFLGGKNKFGNSNGGKGHMVSTALTKCKPYVLSSSRYNRTSNKESDQSVESVLYSSNGSYRSTYKHLPPKKKFKRSTNSEIKMRFNNSTLCLDPCSEKIAVPQKKQSTLYKINHNGEKVYHPQVLVSKQYILKRLFRKDGPPLGEEFDSLPSTSFGFERDSRELHSSQDRLKTSRNKKKPYPSMNPEGCQPENATTEKHGVGKGLMTVWHATNPDKVKCPSDIVFADEFRSSPKKTPGRASKRVPQINLVSKKQIQKKFQQKKRPVVKRKVPVNEESNKNISHCQTCNLFDDESDTEQFDDLVGLVDDEELELREIQVGPNPLQCSHFASHGKHGCPLCKDMLARFPPQTVKMKQLFGTKPWDTSPALVKKLLKVLKLLYNDAASIELCPFTITEFANAFTDKDSMLLGNIHVRLLKFLLLNAERDVVTGYIPRATNKDGRFLGFLNFVKEQDIDVTTWSLALNPLTWIEILRQVLVAAGFGTKSSTAKRDDFSKERHLMVKYGIRPRTLKGELFNILSERGSSGVEVAELAKASQIVALDLPYTIEEVQKVIYSTLLSDITLFEKISSSAYRLRINPEIKGNEEHQSDSEVDDDFDSCSGSNVNSDSDSKSNQKVVKYKDRLKRKSQKKMIEYTEIDESYSGEAWLLGLMEGEYSDLSIDEKLDALMALIDLTGSCRSSRTKELEKQIAAAAPNPRFHGSGAKIKKSLMDHIRTLQNSETASEPSSNNTRQNSMKKSSTDSHPMQCVRLGSDRRYNDYWLFIGPCVVTDPGHRQVYFESSEDGHWEIINTSQALNALISALDRRGSREAHLLTSLLKRAPFVSQAMDNHTSTEYNNTTTSDLDNTSPISGVDNNLDPLQPSENQTQAEKNRRKSWDRMQEHDKWVWDAFYSTLNAVKSYKSRRSYMESFARCESCHDLYCRDERHCRTCHTTFQLDFDIEEKYAIHVATCCTSSDKVLSSQLQALKAATHAIEAVMPEMALSAVWTRSAHKLWAKRLQRTSSLPEFLQVLTDFIGAINNAWLYECSNASSSNAACEEDMIVNFQTIPQTTSAVALWIVKLDALIAPHLEKTQPLKEMENETRPKRKRSEGK